MKINKIVLALGSVLMLFATTLNAQEQPWSFGVKAGGAMSWLQGLGDKKFGKADSKTKPEVGFSGGLTAGYAFHENVGIGLEVLYTQLGGEAEAKPSNTSSTVVNPQKFSIRTHNLVVPVMVKFFPMGCDPEEGVLDIHLGLQGVFPIFDPTVKKSSATSATSTLEEDKSFRKEYLEPVTVSAIVGVGYEFPEIGLTMELRGNFGFMDIFKNETKANQYKAGNDFKSKDLINQFGTVSLGYNFAKLLMD